jgi:uncharacterized transporter YbjL
MVRETILAKSDDVVLAGPTAALIKADAMVGPEIDGTEMARELSGNALGVVVNNSKLHGRTLAEIVDLVGDAARGVFLRDLSRRGQEVPLTPHTLGSISVTS